MDGGAKPPLGPKKAAPKRKPKPKAGGPATKKLTSTASPPKAAGAAAKAAGASFEKKEAAAPVKLVDFKGMFARDLQPMLYGFGDTAAPLKETISIVEDVLIDYMGTMAHRATELAGPGCKVTERELLHLVRKDPRKYARAKELMQMSTILAESKKLVNFDDKEAAVGALQGMEEEEEGGEQAMEGPGAGGKGGGGTAAGARDGDGGKD